MHAWYVRRQMCVCVMYVYVSKKRLMSKLMYDVALFLFRIETAVQTMGKAVMVTRVYIDDLSPFPSLNSRWSHTHASTERPRIHVPWPSSKKE